ncbi:MAG TPA: AraC family transcriptional regulator [Caulobacteraceae bacterium]|jgi:AraC-like DNA-binding protein
MGLGAGWSGDGAHGVWRWSSGGAARRSGLETKTVGEVTLLRVASVEEQDTQSHAEGLTAPKGQVLLLGLMHGDCAFKAADERLKRMQRKEILLALGGAPLALRPEAGARVAGLAVPSHLLAPRFVSTERMRAGALAAHGGGMAPLLYDLISRFTAREALTPGAGALVDAVGGLLSAMLEDCVAAETPVRGQAAIARRDQINRHMRRHFADPELSAGDVARAVGVSRRYLHRLFAEEQLSFREELIALRIEACMKAFLDENQADKTIAEIAFAAGYADISQFNRHFRKLKGATPSALRREAMSRLMTPVNKRPAA